MEPEYRYKDQKKLRCGYTTGTCAATAAKGAMLMLITQKKVENVTIVTPKGIQLNLAIETSTIYKNSVVCGVRKDAGDDPDITDGVVVYAKVEWISNEDLGAIKSNSYCLDKESSLYLNGGLGVGIVTKKGLSCPVGKAAINPVPRAMIRKEVQEICHNNLSKAPLLITISVPEAMELSHKTFNPHLGIIGGISILGSTGIVEPMSEQALIETIKLEINIKKAEGREFLVAVPGNYGESYVVNTLQLSSHDGIKCSNFIGETIDYANVCGVKGLLLVGHIGKLVKLAGGIMNTHSRYADCRMELLAAYAALMGCHQKGIEGILNAVTTDEAMVQLKNANIYEETIKCIMERIDNHIKKRADGMQIGVIVFSNQLGFIGKTSQAEDLLNKIYLDKESRTELC